MRSLSELGSCWLRAYVSLGWVSNKWGRGKISREFLLLVVASEVTTISIERDDTVNNNRI